MRLIPLKEHKSNFKLCVDMFCDSTLERQAESGDLKNRAQVESECQKMLEERLCDSNREIFLFEKCHAIVGFGEVRMQEECFPDEDLPETCVKILHFYIVPHARRQKLGTHFFKLLRDWGRDERAALIEVEVPSYPISAQQFLAHQGLELVGTGVQNCYRAFV